LRLFVAVDVPEALKERIETDVVGRLRPSLPAARWTRPEGRHLTLKFLGRVEDDGVAGVREAVRSVAGRHRAFRAAFSEVGGFPSLRRTRVLWVGVGEGAAPMAALASDLERGLEPLGLEPERRPFRGHLTLARFRSPTVVGELAGVRVPAEDFEVTELVLFESRLHPQGARYAAVERFPLEDA
jgi:2'-5' RNA ligase